MSLDKLESTNRLLHELERKLSISSSASLTHTNQSHASHGSVVHDPAYVGVARENIQLSVLNYIKNNGSSFDAGRVYANRQQKFSATSFDREYSPGSSLSPLAGDVPLKDDDDQQISHGDSPHEPRIRSVASGDKAGKHNAGGPAKSSYENLLHNDRGLSNRWVDATDVLDVSSLDQHVAPLSPSPRSSPKALPITPARPLVSGSPVKNVPDLTYTGEDDYNIDHYDDYYENESFSQDLSNADLEASPINENFSDDDLGLEPEMLLPPLPPRMPPRELDPDKLYGIYDFLGPDPLHCTLSRDEPVYLRNDLDNYWWLIQKLSKSERLLLWNARGSEEDLFDDDEHGKIGFVPAECLETYEERLARLNCFRNENLDNDLDPNVPALLLEAIKPQPQVPSTVDPMPVGLGRKGSILKKAGAFRLNNKLVTFENLQDSRILDDPEMEFSDDDEVGFSDHYYTMTHEDLRAGGDLVVPEADEKLSEVLSDVYPAEVPLQVSKKSRTKTAQKEYTLSDFDQPNMHVREDHSSIGSFSPDTPQQEPAKNHEDAGQVRRSVIIDRLQLVTADLADAGGDATFGGELHADDLGLDADPEGMIPDNQSLKTQLMEEVTTPRASILTHPDIKIGDSDSEITISYSPREKKRIKPVHDMFTPLLGKLDELTEKLAELEQSL